MSRNTQIAVATALALAIMPAVALSQTSAATKAPAAKSTKSGYIPPHLADGRPDISGFWQNGTLTKLNRDASFGERKNYTEDEVRKIEGDNAARTKAFNAPTDPKLGANTPDQCQSGSTGAGCGYNAGWTDPGDHIMRVNGEPRTSLITFPANGRPPAPKTGAGRGGRGPVVAQNDGEGGEGAPAPARPSVITAPARAGGRGGAAPAAGRGGGGGQYDNPESAGSAMRCIMSFGQSSGPIMLSQLYNNNYRFVQGKDTVAIWVEMVHDVRIVRIGAKHRTDGVRPYMGNSIGHYEGNTLVVETTNFPASTNLNGSSANLKMTEKFTRVGPNRLLYQFQAEDPTVWDQPWGGEYEFVSSTGVFEYACHEGNYALEDVLAGARAADKENGRPQAQR